MTPEKLDGLLARGHGIDLEAEDGQHLAGDITLQGLIVDHQYPPYSPQVGFIIGLGPDRRRIASAGRKTRKVVPMVSQSSSIITTMFPDHVQDHGQAKPGSLFAHDLPGIKGFKYMLLIFL